MVLALPLPSSAVGFFVLSSSLEVVPVWVSPDNAVAMGLQPSRREDTTTKSLIVCDGPTYLGVTERIPVDDGGDGEGEQVFMALTSAGDRLLQMEPAVTFALTLKHPDTEDVIVREAKNQYVYVIEADWKRFSEKQISATAEIGASSRKKVAHCAAKKSYAVVGTAVWKELGIVYRTGSVEVWKCG